MTVCTTAPRRAPPGPSRAVRSRASEQQRALRVERALSQSLAELNGAGGVAGVIEASRAALGRIGAALPGSLGVLVILDADRAVPVDEGPPVGNRAGAVVVPAGTAARLRERLVRGGSVAEGGEPSALVQLLGLPPATAPLRLTPVNVLGSCPMVLALAGRAARRSSVGNALQLLATAAGHAFHREEAARELTIREARMCAFVQSASDLVLATDIEDRLIYASPSVASFLGHKVPLLDPVSTGVVIHPDDVEALQATIAETRRRPGPGSPVDCPVRGRDGDWHIFDIVSTNLLDDPNAGAMLLTARDITDRLQLEDQLRHQAFQDPLTGLANRILLKERLKHALVGRVRKGRHVVLLALDLDDFKQVNDTLGHAAGDVLGVTRRIHSCLRPGDTFARLGGDEFAILIEEAPGTSTGEELARSRDPEVRRRVAHRPICPTAALRKLATDVDPWVRGAAAGNPSVPSDLLPILVADPDDRARGGVAANPSVPASLLHRLAVDKAEWVRANVAMNPTRPPDLPAIMAKDSAEMVRLAATGTMRRLDRARWVPGR